MAQTTDLKDLAGQGTCVYCKAAPVEYEADPCGCAALCKRCAMKVASGGKCKLCGELFASVRQTRSKKQPRVGSELEELAAQNLCIHCKTEGIEYEADPCGCASFCKKCAMKVASGGKCKLCGEMFAAVRQVRPGNHSNAEQAESEPHIEISFASEFVDPILSGQKQVTTRCIAEEPSLKPVREGSILDAYADGPPFAQLEVFDVVSHSFAEIGNDLASQEGFGSAAELKTKLLDFYPNITDETEVREIQFMLLRKL